MTFLLACIWNQEDLQTDTRVHLVRHVFESLCNNDINYIYDNQIKDGCSLVSCWVWSVLCVARQARAGAAVDPTRRRLAMTSDRP